MATINHIIRPVSLGCLSIIITCLSSQAQSKKFQPGHFMDVKGNLMTGLIQSAPSGKGPVKNQAFIVFKEDEKANTIELSANDLKYFVAGRDSFVVAPAPMNADWSKNELDFVKVEADEPLKLYTLHGAGGRGSGFGIRPDVGVGVGGGSYGGYAGGGIGISLGSFGGGGRSKTTYYFGPSPAELTQITPQNFIDVMSDVMADEPQMIEQLQSGKYNLNRMEALLAYYRQVKSGTVSKSTQQ